MKEVASNSVNFIFTSPPYNVDKDYDFYQDKRPLEEYLSFLSLVWKECYRVLVDGGRIGINVANLGRKPYIPLSDFISRQLMDTNFLLMCEIIWNKKIGDSAVAANGSIAWGSYKSPNAPVTRDSHEYILFACKKYYKLERDGKTDLTDQDFQKGTHGIWTISPETNRKLLAVHPVPFPMKLARQAIKLHTYINDVVLDPFMGTGTTPYIANLLSRQAIGYDISPTYVEFAKKRCLQRGLHEWGF